MQTPATQLPRPVILVDLDARGVATVTLDRPELHNAFDDELIAALTGITTVSDFRPADMVAGGKGAPLVPFLDYLVFRHPRHGRPAPDPGHPVRHLQQRPG